MADTPGFIRLTIDNVTFAKQLNYFVAFQVGDRKEKTEISAPGQKVVFNKNTFNLPIDLLNDQLAQISFAAFVVMKSQDGDAGSGKFLGQCAVNLKNYFYQLLTGDPIPIRLHFSRTRSVEGHSKEVVVGRGLIHMQLVASPTSTKVRSKESQANLQSARDPLPASHAVERTATTHSWWERALPSDELAHRPGTARLLPSKQPTEKASARTVERPSSRKSEGGEGSLALNERWMFVFVRGAINLPLVGTSPDLPEAFVHVAAVTDEEENNDEGTEQLSLYERCVKDLLVERKRTSAVGGKTETIISKPTRNPVWNQLLMLPVPEGSKPWQFRVTVFAADAKGFVKEALYTATLDSQTIEPSRSYNLFLRASNAKSTSGPGLFITLWHLVPTIPVSPTSPTSEEEKTGEKQLLEVGLYGVRGQFPKPWLQDGNHTLTSAASFVFPSPSTASARSRAESLTFEEEVVGEQLLRRADLVAVTHLLSPAAAAAVLGDFDSEGNPSNPAVLETLGSAVRVPPVPPNEAESGRSTDSAEAAPFRSFSGLPLIEIETDEDGKPRHSPLTTQPLPNTVSIATLGKVSWPALPPLSGPVWGQVFSFQVGGSKRPLSYPSSLSPPFPQPRGGSARGPRPCALVVSLLRRGANGPKAPGSSFSVPLPVPTTTVARAVFPLPEFPENSREAVILERPLYPAKAIGTPSDGTVHSFPKLRIAVRLWDLSNKPFEEVKGELTSAMLMHAARANRWAKWAVANLELANLINSEDGKRRVSTPSIEALYPSNDSDAPDEATEQQLLHTQSARIRADSAASKVMQLSWSGAKGDASPTWSLSVPLEEPSSPSVKQHYTETGPDTGRRELTARDYYPSQVTTPSLPQTPPIPEQEEDAASTEEGEAEEERTPTALRSGRTSRQEWEEVVELNEEVNGETGEAQAAEEGPSTPTPVPTPMAEQEGPQSNTASVRSAWNRRGPEEAAEDLANAQTMEGKQAGFTLLEAKRAIRKLIKEIEKRNDAIRECGKEIRRLRKEFTAAKSKLQRLQAEDQERKVREARLDSDLFEQLLGVNTPEEAAQLDIHSVLRKFKVLATKYVNERQANLDLSHRIERMDKVAEEAEAKNSRYIELLQAHEKAKEVIAQLHEEMKDQIVMKETLKSKEAVIDKLQNEVEKNITSRTNAKAGEAEQEKSESASDGTLTPRLDQPAVSMEARILAKDMRIKTLEEQITKNAKEFANRLSAMQMKLFEAGGGFSSDEGEDDDDEDEDEDASDAESDDDFRDDDDISGIGTGRSAVSKRFSGRSSKFGSFKSGRSLIPGLLQELPSTGSHTKPKPPERSHTRLHSSGSRSRQSSSRGLPPIPG